GSSYCNDVNSNKPPNAPIPPNTSSRFVLAICFFIRSTASYPFPTSTPAALYASLITHALLHPSELFHRVVLDKLLSYTLCKFLYLTSFRLRWLFSIHLYIKRPDYLPQFVRTSRVLKTVPPTIPSLSTYRFHKNMD